MPFYYTPYIILPMLSSAINGGLALYAWRRRNLPVAFWFFLMQLGFSGWSLAYALNTASRELWWKNLFFKFGSSFTMISLCAVVPMVYIFIRERPFPRLMLIGLTAEPLIILVLCLTNDLHGLIRYDMHLVQRGETILFGYRNGICYHLHILYIYTLTATLVCYCLWEACRRIQPRRTSLLLIVAAIATPLVTDLFSISATPEMRMATSALFISGLCYWLAIFRNRMLDLLPIARSALLEQMREPVLIIGKQGLLAEANQAANEILAIPKLSVGVPLETLFGAENPLRRLATAADGDLIRDSSSCWWHVSRNAVLFQASEIGTILVLRDVSELRRIQEKLAESLERERDARAEQERFFDMISHEYRTPLAIIQANIDLLEMIHDDGGGDAGVPASLGKMQRGVHRLVDIFETVRLRKRGVPDNYSTGSESLAIGRFIDSLLALARDFWGEKFVCINYPPGHVVINADSGLLRTAILNLLDNAVKYSPSETTVSIEFDRSPEALYLIICNRSLLPLEEDTSLLFDKFRRGGNSSGTAGTGVGLFLARSIAEQMGGTLDLTVDCGHDVRAVLTLYMERKHAY